MIFKFEFRMVFQLNLSPIRDPVDLSPTWVSE
jgi:hypothetical protein